MVTPNRRSVAWQMTGGGRRLRLDAYAGTAAAMPAHDHSLLIRSQPEQALPHCHCVAAWPLALPGPRRPHHRASSSSPPRGKDLHGGRILHPVDVPTAKVRTRNRPLSARLERKHPCAHRAGHRRLPSLDAGPQLRQNHDQNRNRYLSYFMSFVTPMEVEESSQVTLEMLLDYQVHLFDHRKLDGHGLTFGTQMQRLVPVSQLFSWLRRSGRIEVNPAADLIMPRADRRLPESTLTMGEMSKLLSQPDITKPMGLRDRAFLEVFYSCALRRNELIELTLRDVDFDRGTVFVRCGRDQGSIRAYWRRALFWLRLYIDITRPQFVDDMHPDLLFMSRCGTPMCPDWVSRKVPPVSHGRRHPKAWKLSSLASYGRDLDARGWSGHSLCG